MTFVSRIATIFVFLALSLAVAQDKFTVSGFGGYPISQAMTSLWLAGPDRRPLIMVYFHGPDGWHNTQWKISSKFEKSKPAWAELRSEKARLRLSINTETGDADVQSDTFNIATHNTFLVLHTGEASVPEKVIPLGKFDLLASKDQPASVLLLRAKPELMGRINKEITGNAH